MKIIAQRGCDDIDIAFLDNHHYVFRHATYSNFKNGGIKNPFDKTIYGMGYLGDGKYTGWINGDHTAEYEIWAKIIGRCYHEKDKEKYPSYYDISEVCDEWLNYQNFAEWYYKNKYECEGRLHLDKDIKYPCTFREADVQQTRPVPAEAYSDILLPHESGLPDNPFHAHPDTPCSEIPSSAS